MAKHARTQNKQLNSILEVKSKFDAEFRRFSIERSKYEKLEDFRKLLEELHHLCNESFILSYTDPKDGDLLPLTNDDNFKKALETAKPLLRVILQREADNIELIPNGSNHRLPSIWSPFITQPRNKITISYPQDFRQVAAIIDVDVVPDVCRRVRLLKHGSDKPLGFYIRDGTSLRATPHGIERVPGIFISRVVPGGLAESTGLLAVNDEVLEVNGIEVQGKTLDQVTDMMVANSSNLIITVKPTKQQHSLSDLPQRGSFSRNSAMSSGSRQSRHSTASDDECYDQDEIRDLTQHLKVKGSETSSVVANEGILHL